MNELGVALLWANKINDELETGTQLAVCQSYQQMCSAPEVRAKLQSDDDLVLIFDDFSMVVWHDGHFDVYSSVFGLIDHVHHMEEDQFDLPMSPN